MAPEVGVLVETALAERLDLRAQEIAVEAAVAGESLARTASRPNVGVFGQVGSGYSSLQSRLTDPDAPPVLLPVTLADGTPVLLDGAPFLVPDQSGIEFERTPFFSQLGDNRSGSIGMTISVPIFDRFAARRQREEARLAAENARVELDALQRSVSAEVGLAAVEIAGAEARLDAAEARVEAAQAAVDAEEARYALGAGTPYELAAARSQTRRGPRRARPGRLHARLPARAPPSRRLARTSPNSSEPLAAASRCPGARGGSPHVRPLLMSPTKKILIGLGAAVVLLVIVARRLRR